MSPVRRRPSARRCGTTGRSLPLLAFGVAGAPASASRSSSSFVYIRPYLADSAGDRRRAGRACCCSSSAPPGWRGVAVAGALADRFPRSCADARPSSSSSPPSRPSPWRRKLTAVSRRARALWGAATGAMFPLIQTALMRAASDRLRDLASAAIVVLFNVGIAAGSWMGGQLAATYGPTANMAVSAVVVLIATVFTAVGAALAARRAAVEPAHRRAVGRRALIGRRRGGEDAVGRGILSSTASGSSMRVSGTLMIKTRITRYAGRTATARATAGAQTRDEHRCFSSVTSSSPPASATCARAARSPASSCACACRSTGDWPRRSSTASRCASAISSTSGTTCRCGPSAARPTRWSSCGTATACAGRSRRRPS